MATEADEARYQAIAGEYDRLHRGIRSAEAAMGLASKGPGPRAGSTPSDEVDAAMA